MRLDATFGRHDFTTNRTVTVAVNDGVDSSVVHSVSIGVTAVNDAPVNTVPGALTANEDTVKAITGLSISDADAGTGAMTVTLAITNGTLTVSGGSAAITNNGTSTVTLVGSVSAINATLAASVAYSPTANFSGGATLTMTTSDNGNTGGGAQTDTDTVTIAVAAVNDAPAGTDRTGVSSITIIEDKGYTFTLSDFGFTDANDSPANSLSAVTFTTLTTDATGVLLLNNASFAAGTRGAPSCLGQRTFS